MFTQMLWSLWRLNQIRHRLNQTELADNTKKAERQNTSFPKESTENADLYKPIVKKTMIHKNNVWITVL